MKIIVDGFEKSICKRDNQIVIKEKGKEREFFVVDDLSQVLITGKGSITFDAMELLAKNGVDCLSLDWRGNLLFRINTNESKNVKIRKEQYYALKDSRSGILAKAFIFGKIENQKATLGTLIKSRKDNNELLIQREKLKEFLVKIEEITPKPIDKIRSTLLGIEGIASVEYWKGFRHGLKNDFGFYTRSGRNAQDPINALLNYGYAILQSEIEKSLNIVGLDVYCGFIHADRHGRSSLVFDLIEEFRQQLVDKIVLKIVNKNQVTNDDFDMDDTVIIKNSAKKLIISQILDKIHKKVSYNNKKITYSNIILNQSRSIVNFLIDNTPYQPFYLRW